MGKSLKTDFLDQSSIDQRADDIVNSLITNLDIKYIDPLMSLSIRNLLNKKISKAKQINKIEESKIITNALNYFNIYLYIFETENSFPLINISKREKKKLEIIVNSLIDDSEIDHISLDAVPKLKTVLFERLKNLFQEKNVSLCLILLNQIKKLDKMIENEKVPLKKLRNPTFLPRPIKRSESVSKIKSFIPLKGNKEVEINDFLELEKEVSLECIKSYDKKEYLNNNENDNLLELKIKRLENTVKRLQKEIFKLKKKINFKKKINHN